MTTNRAPHPGFSRRSALQLALGAGAGGSLLAACGREEPSGNETSDTSAPPGSSELSGEVSIALPLSFEGSEDFYASEFARFEENTGVSVNFLPFPDPQYAESIQGLFQSGEAPDVFRMAKPPARLFPAWEKEWIQPLDGYPVIEEALARDYGESALDPAVSGLHIDGQLWAAPGIDNKKFACQPLMINTAVFDEYGVSVPQTWSEYREAAAKITSDSGGDVAGIAFVNDASMLTTTQVRTLMEQSGPVRRVSSKVLLDLQTGRSAASHETMVDAVALLRGLVEDGSVLPGWQNMNPTDFFQAWAAGRVGMAPIAAWWLTEILKVEGAPPYELVEFPVPDSGRGGFMTIDAEWGGTWGMSKPAQNTEAAAALIAYLTSLEHQRAAHEEISSNVSLAHEMPDILAENLQEVLAVSDEVTRLGPSLNARSADTRQLLADLDAAAPEPAINQIIFSAVNEGGDYAAAAAAYDEQVQTVIDEAISAAIADGADFEEDVLAFPDWDPTGDDYVTQTDS